MILYNYNKSIVEDDTDGENYDTLHPKLVIVVTSVGVTEKLGQSAG